MNIFLSMRRATVMAGKRRTGRSASFNSPSSKGFSLDQRANSLSDIAKWQDGSILVKLRSVWCGRRKLNPHELVACQSPVIKQATLHEEQPPAAARARRFAAKNAPAGQRQIVTISVRRVHIGQWDGTPYASLRHGSGQRRLREIHGQRGLWR